MRNLKMILLFSFITLNVFSQEKQIDKVIDNSISAIEKVYGDGSDIVKHVSPKIESALGALGTSLKVGADKVWSLLVKQQLVWSICYLILTLSALFNWWMFYRRYIRPDNLELVDCEKIEGYGDDTYGVSPRLPLTNKTKEYINKNPVRWFIYIHLIVCIILSSFSFYNFSDMLTGFINPEFGALKTITEIATSIK